MKIYSEKELKEFFEKLYSITNKNEPTKEDLKTLCEMREEIQSKIETCENNKNLYGYITKIGFVESLRGSDSHDVIIALLTNRLRYDGFDYRDDEVYKNVMEENAAKSINWNISEETIATLQNMYMLEELNAIIKDLENAE